jgi:hypothetical protein
MRCRNVPAASTQYLLLNRSPGIAWDQARPESIRREGFEEIRSAFSAPAGGGVRLGVSFPFSYFNTTSDATLAESLRRFLQLAAETGTPVLVQLDGESFWDARPDFWNWWDPSKPGFDPANRANVEWSGCVTGFWLWQIKRRRVGWVAAYDSMYSRRCRRCR